MMMKMLEAGGLGMLTDNVRQADEDNPGGYFELEDVKRMSEDSGWLEGASGKAVKIISRLLCQLPADYSYRVIFMTRDLDEVLASQKRLLVNRGTDGDQVDDEEMRTLFLAHLGEVKRWLGQQANFDVLYVDYNSVLENPQLQASAVNSQFDSQLDEARMIGIVDDRLYRQRSDHPT